MRKILTVLGTLVLGSMSLYAEGGDFSVGLRAGTLGIGVEANKSYGEKLNFRLAYNFFEQSQDVNDGDTTYTGDLELSNGGIFADYHPWAGGFRLTGGIMLNDNEVTLNAKPNALTIEIGNNTYDLNGGQVTGVVDFNSLAPYVGMGWGRGVSSTSKWSFLFDLGVMFQGTPDVSISPVGNITLNGFPLVSLSTADIQAEIDQIKNDVEDFDLYPVVSLGFSYRF